jgi:hypothetical protein
LTPKIFRDLVDKLAALLKRDNTINANRLVFEEAWDLLPETMYFSDIVGVHRITKHTTRIGTRRIWHEMYVGDGEWKLVDAAEAADGKPDISIKQNAKKVFSILSSGMNADAMSLDADTFAEEMAEDRAGASRSAKARPKRQDIREAI